MTAKAGLRQHFLTLCQQIPPQKRQAASEKIAAAVYALPDFQTARCIASYASTETEVDTHTIHRLLRDDQTLALPRLTTAGQLTFHQVNTSTPLHTNRYGLLEPMDDPNTLLTLDQIDLFIIPMVAFRPTGERLGRGAAYYDKTLSKLFLKKSTYLGVAFDWQCSNEIETDPWDISMDIIVTDCTTYDCRNSSISSENAPN